MSIEGVRSKTGWEKPVQMPAEKPEKKSHPPQPEETLELNSQSPEKPGLIKRFANACNSGINKVGDGLVNFIEKNITGKTSVDNNGQDGGIYKSFGSYGNKCHNHARYVAIGASGGGAIGTAVGLFGGYEEIRHDQVELVWKDNAIKDPRMNGFSHWSSETGYYTQDYVGTDSQGRSQYVERWVHTGYNHSFSPKIGYDQVGSYKSPEYSHSAKWNPISAGFVGLVSGTAIGGVVGFAVSVATKLIRNSNFLSRSKS